METLDRAKAKETMEKLEGCTIRPHRVVQKQKDI